MTEALATRAASASAISTAEQVALVKRTIMPAGSSDDELKLFVGQCNRTGLDPFSRQIYALKMGGRISTMVGIDGFRIIAERSGLYAGQQGPWWCGDDGKWLDVWLDSKPPCGGPCGRHAVGLRRTALRRGPPVELQHRAEPLEEDARAHDRQGGRGTRAAQGIPARPERAVYRRRDGPSRAGGRYASQAAPVKAGSGDLSERYTRA